MASVDRTTTKTVDFAPEYGLNGDFRKIKEYDMYKFNSRIMPILNLIYMDKGANQLSPEMGLRDLFMDIPFSERATVNSIILEISRQISIYTNESVEVSEDPASNWITGDIGILIDVNGIPAPIKISATRANGGTINVAHPSIFKK